MAARPPVPEIDEPDDAGARVRPAAGSGVGHRRRTCSSWPGPCSRRTIRRCFLGGFLFFLGFAKATAAYQSRIELKTPLLVGFFLAGLVIHGGLQGWWIAPVLARLAETPLFLGATLLTAFNDNALITYLATLVPNLERAAEDGGGARER